MTFNIWKKSYNLDYPGNTYNTQQDVKIYQEVIGKTITKIEYWQDDYNERKEIKKDFETVHDFESDEPIQGLIFYFDDNTNYCMSHSQDCCEYVRLFDVCGDLNDLINAPLVEAEEVTQIDEEMIYQDSHSAQEVYSRSWTFYKFRTINGNITLRWIGESNGCYSEEVSFSRSFF